MMTNRDRGKRGSSPLRAGWLLGVVLVVFTLSVGAAVHNHGLFGSGGSAEKVSQSQFTCPACVFDGKPITIASATIVTYSSCHLTVVCATPVSFERILSETRSSRAPPIV
jgi:hypothetical protein